MPIYSKKTMQHFKKPRNAGFFCKNAKNIGTGIIGSPECGDVMQLQIAVNPETNRIEDAKFKTFGCVSAIATSSLITEKIKGLTLEEAINVTNKDIADELTLPAIKLHCSVLAEQAVRKAIVDYINKHGGSININSNEGADSTNSISASSSNCSKCICKCSNYNKDMHNVVQCTAEERPYCQSQTTPPITLTHTAIAKIENYISESGNMYVGVRLRVEQDSGCSGMKYNFKYVKEVEVIALDVTVKISNNVTLFIDSTSLQYIVGTSIDYLDDGMHARFIFNNPNAHVKCRCGESFNT